MNNEAKSLNFTRNLKFVLSKRELSTVKAALNSYRDLLTSPTSADRDANGHNWADDEIRTCEGLLALCENHLAPSPNQDHQDIGASADKVGSFLAMLATVDLAIIDGHIQPAYQISHVVGDATNEVVRFFWHDQGCDRCIKLTESGLGEGQWSNGEFHCVDHEGDPIKIALRWQGQVVTPQTMAAGTLDQQPSIDATLAARAEAAFEEYDFGDGVLVTDVCGWSYSTPGHERTRKVYVETQCDGDSHFSSTALTFTVRFDADTGQVAEATAFDDKGQSWGCMASDVASVPSAKTEVQSLAGIPTEQLKSAVLNAAFYPNSVKAVQGTGFLAAVHLSTNTGIFVVAGNFGREHFKKALTEAEQAGLKTNCVYVYAQTGTYSGNAIHFTKFDEIGIDMMQFDGPPDGSSDSYTATEEDVENVLRSNALFVANTKGKTFESIANEVFADLDFDLIDQAALGGDSVDEKTDLANDEIARQLRQMGILEPLQAVTMAP